MEERRYYIPSIDEFYPGFEYEQEATIYTDKGWFTHKGLIIEPKIYDPNDYLEAYYLSKRVKRGIFKSSIRVKYLDKQDFKELGWARINDGQYFIKDYTILVDDDLFLQVIKDDLENDIYLFQGTIKNKSELKKLLNQLGIWTKKKEI